VAAQITVDTTATCQQAGIGLTNVGGTPIKAKNAEEFLRSKALDDGNISQAASLAADEAHPSSDLRGPAEYKVAMVRELTKRALTKALNRATQEH
jgi:carbon-monoxide dehydrogenase medium subunit